MTSRSGLLAHGLTVLTKLSVQGMVTRSRLAERDMAAGSSDPHVALTAADIPGADLSAPFDRHTVPDGGCCAYEASIESN